MNTELKAQKSFVRFEGLSEEGIFDGRCCFLSMRAVMQNLIREGKGLNFIN